ncbi:MAG: response regulator [Desulfobacteraceae bacterium]|nr:response regulator [Desulfobacteraceae bacterium]
MKEKILIIDDEEGIRFTFKAFLSDEGYTVFTAEDYHSALKTVSEEKPDLIFADIILGEHTGIEILRKIREKGVMCPVVMVTGQPNVDTATDSVRLGAFDYLMKPIRYETLLRSARMALEHKALVEEKERYRNNLEAIFRSVTDAIITVDNEMRVTESNAAVEEVCGITPEKIIGKPFHKVFDEKFESCRNILLETLEKQITIRERRMECKHPDQPRQVMQVTGSPLLDLNNQAIGAVLVLKDITRLTDLEMELKEQNSFHNIIGKSMKMQGIYKLVEDLSEMPTTVLISGESGTGKELVARALHYSGPRSFKPLVTINCTTLPESLLESELFGHVRGAFTGADKSKTGRFQAAHKGSIFLDEIGELSPLVQVKLLRVLQEREFNRVGDSNPVRVDVRVITATNRRLEEEVRQGNFREDLYYRLKVMEIVLPPLRDRTEDIPLLVKHFCKHHNKSLNKNVEGLTDEVLAAFMCYTWPGNVRELKHVLERAFVLCHGNTIFADHIPFEVMDCRPVRKINRNNKQEEREKILRALNRTDWNKSKTARLLGISRKTLYQKILKHRIQQQDMTLI